LLGVSSVLPRAVNMAVARDWLWHRCVAFFWHSGLSHSHPPSTPPCGTSAYLHQQYCHSAPQAHRHPTCS